MSQAQERAFLVRTFDLAEGSEHHELRVLLDPPQPRSDGGWRCHWHLDGIADDVVREAGGADGWEALLTATKNAATHLYTSLAWKQGRLTFRGARDLLLPLHGDLTLEDFLLY